MAFKNLAEALILQALDDMWNERISKKVLTFSQVMDFQCGPQSPVSIPLNSTRFFLSQLGDWMRLEITSIAHSLRNPLNTIRGAVKFIREEYSSDDNLMDFTGIIEDEITRLETLVSQLLDSSSFNLVKGYVDINNLLKGIEAAITLQAILKNIDISFGYNKIPMVKIDAFQIEQAIRNIINNAIVAMPNGGQLIVRTGVESDNVIIEITDTGVGIHRHLFSHKGSPGNKRRGFGLYIAHQILNIHGGRLMISSGEGGGTIVKMFIPIIKERRLNDGKEKRTDR